MASLNEIAYNIKNMAYGGSSTTNEENIGIRQIKFWVHYYRAELIKEFYLKGKNLPYEFYQKHQPVRKDVPYMRETYGGGAINTLANEITGWEKAILVYSARVADLANAATTVEDDPNTEDINEAVSSALSEATVAAIGNFWDDFYGQDFYEYNLNESNYDYGRIEFAVPELINVNHGITNLEIRKSGVQGEIHTNQNTRTINVPIVTKQESQNSKYNRFTKNSIKAHIETRVSSPYSQYRNECQVRIDRLRSVYKSASDGLIKHAIPYAVYLDGLFANPTEASYYRNDDDVYPIPEYLISELNQNILSKEMALALSTISDDLDDERDSTKIIQSKAQGQVRKRS
jgi:hypothetical protein